MRAVVAISMTLAVAIPAKAYDFAVDGIYYNILDENATVAVTYQSSNSYSGDIEIPSIVKYSDTEYSVTKIGDYAFYGCIGLTSIELPSSVTSIGDYVFYNCTGLTSIELPSSLTTIVRYAFSGCTGLTSVELPNSLITIEEDVFEGCTGLTSIELPSSVTSIGMDAFEGCTGLTSIELPSSVTSIGMDAFEGCTGLTSIELPSSVTLLGESAFSGCSGLESIVVNSGNQYYDSRDGCNAIIETSSNTLISGCKNTKIPSSVTSIGSQAFSGCTGLTSIEIPNSVTSIGWQAFSGCTGLTSIEIPNSVTSIGWQAFSGCTGLTSIELPRSLTSLGSYVFLNCNQLKTVFYNAVNLSKVDYDDFEKKNVTTIIVGKEVENMPSIFSDYTECTTIVSVNPVPPVCEEGAFSNIDKSKCVLYVPKDSYLDYWEADEWKEFANIKAIEHEVTGLSLDDISIPYGTSLQLENIITPENATIKDLVWTSSNYNIATVSSNGLVSGVSVGEAIITATATDGSGIKASCKVTVTPVLAESIKLNKSSVIMDVYESEVLATTILPSNTSDKSLIWSSSNESVAKVKGNDDGTGTVMLIAEGYAVITATTNDGSNLSASCVVSSSAGIDDVFVDDNAPAEYYNLQGVKVDNPTNGLYIKKQGGKATKVIL